MQKLIGVFFTVLSFSSFVFSQNLSITEVFIDGTDEFVEISNMSSTDFYGDLALSGVKSSIVSLSNLSIPAWTSLVVGDNLSMVDTISTIFYKTGLALSIIDSNAFSASLRSGTALLDTFSVTQGDVVASDNHKKSFHKVFAGDSFSIILSSSSLSYNVLDGTIAHPGRVYDADGAILLPNSSQNLTGSSISLDCSTLDDSIVTIDEVYHGSGYADYIELVFSQDWYGGLIFSGNSFSTGFALPEQIWEKNTRYLVANSLSGFVHTENIIEIPGRSLSTGLVVLSSSSNQNLDFVLLDRIGQSVYHTTDYNCLAGFATQASPSPGFDQVFLSYLNTITETIVIAATGTQTNSSGSSDLTSSDNTLLPSLQVGDIVISMIDYDPVGSDTNNERISFVSHTGDISMSGLVLSYDGKLYTFSTGVVSSGQESVFTGNFSFVNSRTVCVALYQENLLLDTVCYDPSENSSPFYPLLANTGTVQVSSGVEAEEFDYSDLVFNIRSLVYDPEGSDTNNESITLYFSGALDSVLLDDFRLRVGTSNKRIYGTISSGETKTFIGNFQMSNSKSTCVALTYKEIVYDEYCYNPISYSSNVSTSQTIPQEQLPAYSSHSIAISDVVYNPDGSDTDRETIQLLMTGNQSPVDLTKLYIRFGSSKRLLQGTLQPGVLTTLTGNFQLPNSKATCIDLMEGNHLFDTYCYDPNTSLTEAEPSPQTDEISLNATGSFSQKKVISDSSYDRLRHYSGLTIEWILPNPEGKDIAKNNEMISFLRSRHTGQVSTLTKQVKIVVGKKSFNLSGVVFSGDRLLLVAPVSLINQAACAKIIIDGKTIDQLCYPQAEEGYPYYHLGLSGSQKTLPSSLITMLDKQGVDLSDLLLKKSGSKICLVYDKVLMRCLTGGTTKTALKTKQLNTLSNAYIRSVSDLISSKQIQYTNMKDRSASYQTLAKLVKAGKNQITIRSHTIKTTDIEAYHALVYQRKQDDVLVDALLYTFLGNSL